MSHLKRWDGSSEDGTSWRFNRHRDSLDITDEELGNSIVSVDVHTCVCFLFFGAGNNNTSTTVIYDSVFCFLISLSLCSV